MMGLVRYKRFWVILLLPLSLLATAWAKKHPRQVEAVYSTGIYPVIRGVAGRITSLLPFSLAELFLCLLVLGIPIFAAWFVRLCLRNRKKRWLYLRRFAATLACLVGLVSFSFTFFCGLNYHRMSFASQSGLPVRDSSPEELAALCAELVGEANRLRGLTAEDENGVMQVSYSSCREASAHASSCYAALAQEYPVLDGFTVRPKPVLFSRGMSRLNIVGIYIPFTFEANINTDVPDYSIPSSILHEQAHFKGFMREDEANFLSYLASRSGDNTDFTYSGVMLALSHTRSALYSANQDYYYEVMSNLSEEVNRDFAANREYWKQFEGPVAEVSTAVNDAYLKTNNQESGVKSYGRMVDLLLADYRHRHGLE